MREATENIPLEELSLRRERCLKHLADQHPEAGGLLVLAALPYIILPVS